MQPIRFEKQRMLVITLFKIMMDHIIADALVAGESEYLEDKLSQLRKFEERIENWDLQGLVFLDYFTAVSIIEQIKQSQTVFF